jgi:hypothetical protein
MILELTIALKRGTIDAVIRNSDPGLRVLLGQNAHEVGGAPENVDDAGYRQEEWLQILRDRKDRGDQLGAATTRPTTVAPVALPQGSAEDADGELD